MCSPDAVQCVFKQVELFGGDCDTPCGATVATSTTDCWSFHDAGTCTGVRARAMLVPDTAGCAPVGGGVKELPPAFDRRVVMCVPKSDVGVGCTDGAVCVPAEANCYYTNGSAKCAPNERQLTLYQTQQADTRDCARCTCDTNCVGTVHRNQNGCGNFDCDDDTEAYSDVADPCFELAQPSSNFAFKYCSEVQCIADGGQPIGEAGFSDEITVCCPP